MIGECSYGEKERERSKKTGKLITLNVCDEDFIKSKMGLQINKGV
jgi:hypothetical protein